MDANRELVSCMGRCLIFKPTSRGVVSWPGYTEMKDYTLLQNDPVERMIAHMNPYTCSTIYSVVRTPVWKTAMSILSERNFSVFAIGEYQFELAVSFLGKSKVLDSLMWLRSGENPTATPAPLWGKHKLKMFYRWWIDKDTFDERKEFLDIMSDSLALSSPIDRTTIYRGVEKAAEEFSQYTSSHYKMNYPKRKYYFGVALAHLIKYVPRRVRNGLKELSWQYKPRPLITSIESLEKLSLAGITFDKSELSEIEEVLINFHNHQLRK